MEIKVKRLYKSTRLPFMATVGSGCYDVCALLPSPRTSFILEPINVIFKIGTGLAFEVPMGYLLDVRPRSGLSSKGVFLVNSPGTLDSDYRGELFILLWNFSSKGVTIKNGDRIAQVRIVPLIYPIWKEVDELGITERGSKCLGSTD